MIFATVGTQLPFDRLFNSLDTWAETRGAQEIVAQTGTSEFQSSRMDVRRMIDAPSFRSLVKKADVLVAHAGMGSILTAIEYAKPVIIMPRRAEFGEHRNDHQMATAENLAHLSNLRVVYSAAMLEDALDEALNTRPVDIQHNQISQTHQSLLSGIQDFIFAEAQTPARAHHATLAGSV
ncbi:glycosyltransferase [Shimia thalassica]|uniref:glycosyltransferase n=1 Tax=Shimia thalassica TaxID=1715693 RepID=UPI0026E40981|nr:glycosyltransferase [Shimia thalassica]MDO6798743.1 glycosyltransferase [Shimia thalassica]